MSTTANVVLDFTKNSVLDNQPVAVMPAALAKRLLKDFASRLANSTPRHIIGQFRDSIDVHGTVEDSVQLALSYVQERDLIENVAIENWDAYAVPKAV